MGGCGVRRRAQQQALISASTTHNFLSSNHNIGAQKSTMSSPRIRVDLEALSRLRAPGLRPFRLLVAIFGLICLVSPKITTLHAGTTELII